MREDLGPLVLEPENGIRNAYQTRIAWNGVGTPKAQSADEGDG